MKFIVDEQLPPALASWIAGQPGCTAAHIFEYGSRSKPDMEIAEIIQREHAVLVTKDDDFVRIHAKSVDRIVWVRCGNIVNRKLVDLFERNWPRVMIDLKTLQYVEIR